MHLIKVPLLLVKVGSQSIGSLNVNHEVLHLTLQPLLGLLQGGALGVHSLNGFLSILQALGKLFPVVKRNYLILSEQRQQKWIYFCKSRKDYILGLLQLLSALDSISLIFGSPLSHLTVGLGHSSL